MINKSKEKYMSSDGEQKLLTDEQYNELVSLSSRQSVDKYISKILSWQKTNHKRLNNPYETIKGWIKQDSKGQKNKNTSYDLDEWEKFAMNFDPTKAGGNYD